MIRMLVSRCHVSDSYLSVVRYVISRMKNGHQSYKEQSREDRRYLLREIAKEHNHNQEIYSQVSTGQFK